LLQAGRSLSTLAAARGSLLLLILELGAAAVVAATVGGLLLTRQAIRPIHAAFAAQRAFVADASHELRTPVTLVRTTAEVLLETGALPAAEDRALVEDIVAVSGRMGRLIADLITLARLDAGGAAPRAAARGPGGRARHQLWADGPPGRTPRRRPAPRPQHVDGGAGGRGTPGAGGGDPAGQCHHVQPCGRDGGGDPGPRGRPGGPGGPGYGTGDSRGRSAAPLCAFLPGTGRGRGGRGQRPGSG